MIKLPLDFLWIPLVGIIPIVAGLYEAKKEKKFTIKAKWELFIGIVVILLSLNNSLNEKVSLSTINGQNDTLKLKVGSLTDTLRTTRDSLIKIGLSIDNKTGHISIMDSQILKKVLQLRNISVTIPIEQKGLSDSANYTFRLKYDTLYLSPKEGTWAHGYIAFDTSNGIPFERMMHEGEGTGNEVDKINVNGKIYMTHLVKIFDRAVYKAEPISLRMSGQLKRYIIFGDEGIPTKRWIYQNDKVKWIPER